MQKYVVNRLSTGDHAQSISEELATDFPQSEYKSLLPEAFFKYMKICTNTSQLVVIGAKRTDSQHSQQMQYQV